MAKQQNIEELPQELLKNFHLGSTVGEIKSFISQNGSAVAN